MEAGEESQLATQSLGERRRELAATVLPILLALLAGLALRLWMLRNVFEVNGDSLIYGGLAKNLLLHGQYDLTTAAGKMYPTLIRLPGYPIFLALCFRLFGMENYFSAAELQIGFDLLGCLLLAGVARRVVPAAMSRRVALATLWLAVLCPFTASYTAEPLTETLTLFALALAMWAMVRFRDKPSWAYALWFAGAVSYAALLRPDGALAAIFFVGLFPGFSARKVTRMAMVCILLALAPFAIWTARNWRVFHVIEPLAPRLATDPGETGNPGWERWVKSWCLDFISTYQIYWNVPGDKLKVTELPRRAFDSPEQYAETAALAHDYNNHGMELTPETDARFGRLADERIAADPVRYHLWLPLGRLADMWLRPRVEDLNIDLDWWVYSHHRAETRFCWAYAGLNAVFLGLGIVGLCFRPRFWGAMLAYIVLRSALLLTIEAPETRYTIECFPMLIVCGGIAIAWLMGRRKKPAQADSPENIPQGLKAKLILRHLCRG
jgi:hypothetical protein